MQAKQMAKKIRKILLSQKSRLENYVELLGKEEENLLKENPDKLIRYINLEKQVIDELACLKKIAEPLEIMYSNSPYKKNTKLIDIKDKIGNLKDQVATKSTKNKEKLETILISVKADLKGFLQPETSRPNCDNTNSSIVDVCG